MAFTVLVVLVGPSSALAFNPNTTSSGRVIRWGERAVSLRADPSFETMLAVDDTRAALEIAVEAWRGIGEAPDVLVGAGDAGPVGYDGRTDNTISAHVDWPYEAEKLAVTVITYELDTGRLLDADILVNAAAPFALADPDAPRAPRYDLAAVLTHEVGHLLGLDESEDDPRATMWPYASPGDTHQRTLSEDDELSIDYAYSRPLPGTPGCGQARVLGARPMGAHRGLLACALVLLGWVAVRRRRHAPTSVPLSVLAVVVIAGAMGPGRSHADRQQLHGVHLGGAIPLASEAAQHRMRALTADAGLLRFGRAERVASRMVDGRIVTDYVLRGADGGSQRFTAFGGEVDGIVQRLAERRPPAHGAAIALGTDTGRWAYADGAVLRGGVLGHGPGIALE